ncbi:MAG TPA: SurA N-terminal domain-containing protein [Pusillimonas sp.]|uniref:SurA N-terminal domain-containing protein n=1 Tax=unclassified Pusillimonas TaxID=2640016 RepID=UPI002624A61B|nr:MULTISPECIES: SurA N-terminal domain-containing protein [unclassified Pusillimonas]HLU20413.1 SurA N-terminal domain-containing protein [Pusillimonas sp.]
MFEFIRTHQRLMQLVLLILILPSFALIGVSGYTTYMSGDHDLVQIGDSAITQQEFDEARRNQLQRLQANAGGAFDPAILDTPQARSALLESLIERRLIIDEATKERFSVSDAMLREAIASIPELQVDGRFSPQRYNEVLAAMGISSREFEQGQRAELALQRVLGPIGATARVPASVSQAVAQALTSQRTVRLRAFDAADYQDDIQITDADIKAWYKANPDQLQVPEYVSASYLLLDEAAAMQGVPEVSESEMLAYYEQNKSRYVMPARVQVSHILFDVPSGASDAQRAEARKKAEAVAEKAKADPTRFAELAKTESDDAGTANEGGRLGWITKGSWPEALEEAVFSLEKGQTSGVVEGPDGYHVFLAEDVQPETGETFEQAKAKVQSEIRRQLAADRYAEMATKLTDLVYDDQTSLQPAAQALGLQVRQANGIARDGLLDAADLSAENPASQSPDAQILNDARVRRALFSGQTYTDRHNSGVIEISPGVLVVVRIDDITPAHVLPLEKAQDFIRERLLAERSRDAARKAGEALLAELQANNGAEAPEGFGTAQTISRIDTQGLSKPVLDAAFAADAHALPVYVGVEGGQGYVLVRVEAAEAGKDDPTLNASLTAQISQALGAAEQAAVLRAMREAAKVRMLPDAEEALKPEGQQG